MSSEGRGRLFVLSAPSGTGKTTLARRLVTEVAGLRLSRSYTSRPPRAGEQDGVDYTFVTPARFEAMIAAGAFLEWAVFVGRHYGTGAAETERCLSAGDDLLLVIDVQGARRLRERGVRATGIFVVPPSFDALEERLRARGLETEEQVRQRLATARDELAALPEYDYVVVNDEVAACVNRLKGVVAHVRTHATTSAG